jgi:galactonate dehydratase
MKITRICTYPVKPRWIFLKIETDEGLYGWGECLGDKAFLHAETIRSFEQHLIGQDPRRIVHNWQSLYRGAFWRGGPTLNAAISGLEMAMWDINGKWLGAPVYQLLGGSVRDRIRMYSHLGGRTPAEMAQGAKAMVEKGFTGIKFTPLGKCHVVEHYRIVEEAAANVQAVREAVGSGIDIMLDFHGRVGPAMAVWLEEAIRPFHPMFIEEPALPENVDAMAKLACQFKTPIATGERLFTKWGFREVLEKNAASILQPDPCICGGIFEARMIGAMAETYFAALAPHNPYGPVNLAAALQIDACAPNFLVQEFVHLGEGYLKEPFVMKDGYIEVPTKPGLGIDVDEDFVKENALTGYLPDIGRWFHEDDGSVADW